MSFKAPTGGFGAMQFGEMKFAYPSIEEDRFEENDHWYRSSSSSFLSSSSSSWYISNQNQLF